MGRNTAASPKAEASPPEPSAFAPSWFLPSPGQPRPKSPTHADTPSGARLWTWLMGARLVVAMGLFALQAVAYVHGTASLWLLGLCGAYLVATAAVLR